jgi:hypothetical protein
MKHAFYVQYIPSVSLGFRGAVTEQGLLRAYVFRTRSKITKEPTVVPQAHQKIIELATMI